MINKTRDNENSHEELKNLSAYLQEVREEERKNIAREIHDELGQSLTTMKLELSLLREEVLNDATAATRRIQILKDMVDGTIQSVKQIITKLRPGLLDDLGLAAAIEWQSGEFQMRTGIVCQVRTNDEEKEINPEISTALFRIFQEALTNVTRHSGATRVTVDLEHPEDAIELRVHDNGRGITEKECQDPKSFGLIGIRERVQHLNGRLEINGEPNSGTTLRIRVPYQPENGK
jgi:signal transduction histidine kinase